jgi:hypothetical protein
MPVPVRRGHRCDEFPLPIRRFSHFRPELTLPVGHDHDLLLGSDHRLQQEERLPVGQNVVRSAPLSRLNEVALEKHLARRDREPAID